MVQDDTRTYPAPPSADIYSAIVLFMATVSFMSVEYGNTWTTWHYIGIHTHKRIIITMMLWVLICMRFKEVGSWFSPRISGRFSTYCRLGPVIGASPSLCEWSLGYWDTERHLVLPESARPDVLARLPSRKWHLPTSAWSWFAVLGDRFVAQGVDWFG